MDDASLLNSYAEFCEQIEEKIFETGLFTKFLGKNFDLSIDPVLNKNGLSLQIKLSSTKKQIDHEAKMEMSYYIFNKFQELAELSLSKRELKNLEKKWYETLLMLDNNIIFAID